MFMPNLPILPHFDDSTAEGGGECFFTYWGLMTYF